MLVHNEPLSSSSSSSIETAMDITFDDNLSYITNPQERRRIQNRISQRNYRERMKNMESSNKSRQTNKPLTWTQPHTIPRPPGRKRNADQVPGTIPPAYTKSPRQQQRQQTPQPQRQRTQSPEEQYFMITPASSDCSGPTKDTEIVTTSATTADIQWASDLLPVNFEDAHHTPPELQTLNSSLLSPTPLSTSLSSLDHCAPGGLPFENAAAAAGMEQQIDKLRWPDEDFGFTLPPSMRGFNTLHIASHKGQATIIRTLLATTKGHQLDVDSMTGDGRSALHIAALARHADVVKELLRAGANALLRDCDGQTAMHMAAKSGDIAVAEQILKECAECLLLRDNSMQTPLHQAVIHGHEDMVKFLLERGADPSAIIL